MDVADRPDRLIQMHFSNRAHQLAGKLGCKILISLKHSWRQFIDYISLQSYRHALKQLTLFRRKMHF